MMKRMSSLVQLMSMNMMMVLCLTIQVMKLAATRNRRRKSKLSKLSYCTFICNVSVVPGRLSYFLPSLSSIAIVIAKSNDSTQESSVVPVREGPTVEDATALLCDNVEAGSQATN